LDNNEEDASGEPSRRGEIYCAEPNLSECIEGVDYGEEGLEGEEEQ
jgi:hypothetical protein